MIYYFKKTFKKAFSPFEVAETQTIPSKTILFEEGKISDSYTLSIKVPVSAFNYNEFIAVGHIIKTTSCFIELLEKQERLNSASWTLYYPKLMNLSE